MDLKDDRSGFREKAIVSRGGRPLPADVHLSGNSRVAGTHAGGTAECGGPAGGRQ